MPGAMGWFRSSALVTVIVGLRYFTIHLASDARVAGDRSLIGKWFGWWLVVWLVAYVFIYALQLPAKGILNNPWLRVIGVSVVVIAASWLVLVLNGGPDVSNAHLAISVGGGLGLVMLLNTWGVVWRVQKKLIAWSRLSNEQGAPMPPEAERLMRWNYLTARTSFWLSFPMLFFMARPVTTHSSVPSRDKSGEQRPCLMKKTTTSSRRQPAYRSKPGPKASHWKNKRASNF